MTIAGKEIIMTKVEKCVGCNKCIAECPVKANIAYVDKGQSKVKVDQKKCIYCGTCIQVCAHHAREYEDDTMKLFTALRKRKKVTMIVAPSIRFNFFNYKRLYGWLKSLGVNLIYAVTYGADITTWAYLKIIQEKRRNAVIAQHCPVIVNYVEKYLPELISSLAPIHSPMMCTAIYIKKYLNIQDELAFLSPCIGKYSEINDPNNQGFVQYNITFKKLADYINIVGVDLNQYAEVDYDDQGSGIGLAFSRPGGLRENVEFYVKDAWTRQVEGPEQAYMYLKKYAEQVQSNVHMPLLVEILNCQHGCNIGTGTSIEGSIDYKINLVKAEKIKQSSTKKVPPNRYQLFEEFDKQLKVEDFVRSYSNNSAIIC